MLGDRLTDCGPNGAGQATKGCNQIVAAQMSDIAECRTLDNRVPQMIRGEFDPGFFAEYQYKDLRIATDAGEAFGSPMPLTALAHELYKTMEQNEAGRDDNSGVMRVLEMMAGEGARRDS